MIACVTTICFVALVAFVQTRHCPAGTTDYWDRIRSLAKQGTPQGNPELVDYLRSLRPEEMLTCARQACAAAAAHFTSDTERKMASAANVGLCLPYYLEKFDDSNEGAARLLEVIGNPKESPWLRRALIDGLRGSATPPFARTFQSYAAAHYADVAPVLTEILRDQREHAFVRDAAIAAVASLLDGQFRAICSRDPNVRALKEESRKIVPVGKLVRSGQLTLSEQTWEALKPLEGQVLRSAQSLGRILADEAYEPEMVRGRAEAMLKVYDRLPLTEKSYGELDKILRQADE